MTKSHSRNDRKIQSVPRSMMPLFNPRDVVACIHAFPERIIDILTVTRILRVVRRLFRLDQQWLLSHRAIDLQRAIQERHGCRHNVSDDRRGECALHVARCVIGNKIYAARGDRSGMQADCNAAFARATKRPTGKRHGCVVEIPDLNPLVRSRER